ncbi:hypothetical protein TELCIR_03872 [Teladorsagia circumcincta]|uniref:glucuronosyltransferase n=1 Tax=Teladorsagia circumcincta TaxID=45464 RepID=A0A2G9UV54_TELCI|nr:hypothetical protein TELCIR_03872 [Teladorsagia circumcincta]
MRRNEPTARSQRRISSTWSEKRQTTGQLGREKQNGQRTRPQAALVDSCAATRGRDDYSSKGKPHKPAHSDLSPTAIQQRISAGLVADAIASTHPRLRCFVSHAGLNSVMEVARNGKPSILVPIFADQIRNARFLEAKNATIVITKEEFNRDTFSAALKKMLNNKSLPVRPSVTEVHTSEDYPVR